MNPALRVIGPRCGEVQPKRPAANHSTLEVIQCSTSLVNRGELDVTEPLGTAALGVCWQANTNNVSLLGEGLADIVFAGTESDVTNKQRVTLGAGLIPERLCARLSTLARINLVGITRLCKVEVDGAPVDLGPRLGIVRFLCVFGICEFNIAESGPELVKSSQEKRHKLTLASDQTRGRS